jgi:hypothetical protein
MSVENPSPDELEASINTQKTLASEELGFDVNDPKNRTPDNEHRFLDWINRNGGYFRQILERNPDVWERVKEGRAEYSDIRWIMDQLCDRYDTGAEDHAPEPEPDA